MTGAELTARIDDLLRLRGKTRKELSYSCDIAANALSMWKNRNSLPAADTACKIAQFLGVSVEYLLTGEGAPDAPGITRKGAGFYIPLMPQKVSAGQGEMQSDDSTPLVWLRIPYHLKSYGDRLAAVCVKGDSMTPTFHNGDIVIVDLCGYDGDGVYALCIDGDYFIKRITKMGSVVHISSDNANYQSWEIKTESDTVKIIGRVHCALHNYD